jgi:hypothetical protein
MKGMLGNKKRFLITSVAMVVMVAAAAGLWNYRSAEAIRIETSGDYLSIDMSLAPQSPNPQTPSGAYSDTVVAEKSANYYELDYPGSGGKIEIGDAAKTSNFKPDLTISTWDKEAEFKLIAPASVEEKSQLTTSLAGDTVSASNGEWAFQYKPVEPKEGFNDKGGLDIVITAKTKLQWLPTGGCERGCLCSQS